MTTTETNIQNGLDELSNNLITTNNNLSKKIDTEWLVNHKHTKYVEASFSIAKNTYKQVTIPLGLSGGWLITGMCPFINGETHAFVTNCHCEGTNLKVTVTNIRDYTINVVIGAVIDYIQL